MLSGKPSFGQPEQITTTTGRTGLGFAISEIKPSFVTSLLCCAEQCFEYSQWPEVITVIAAVNPAENCWHSRAEEGYQMLADLPGSARFHFISICLCLRRLLPTRTHTQLLAAQLQGFPPLLLMMLVHFLPPSESPPTHPPTHWQVVGFQSSVQAAWAVGVTVVTAKNHSVSLQLHCICAGADPKFSYYHSHYTHSH
jgi:hypothetical protein